MDLTPFRRLAAPRAVDRRLPPELADFYARHEGVGLDTGPDRFVRLCTLGEVVRVGWADVGSVGDVPEAWGRFAALRVGLGMQGEWIVYVLDAPSCPPGSVLAVGTYLVGVGAGGEGSDALDGTLVLAASFPGWLAHLEMWGWAEPIIAGMGNLPADQHREACRYYLALNPGMDVGPEGPRMTRGPDRPSGHR